MVTDRPTDSASPVLVPKRMLQFEAGYKFTRLDSEPGPSDTHTLPELLTRYGINKRIELRLTGAGWTFENATQGDVDGFNDIVLGTKIALADERGRRPQMGLLVDVSVPVGSSDLTSEYANPEVLLLASHTLTERLGLTYNVGPEFVTMKSEGDRQTDVYLQYAVALSGVVRGPFSLFGEVYGTFAMNGERPDRHAFQVGTTVLLSSNFQIDLRGGLGQNDDDPYWLTGLGLAVRLPI